MAQTRDVSWQTGEPGSAPAGPPRRRPRWRSDAHAVIIGIDVYQDKQIPDLRFARKDAEAVYDVLTDPKVGRFPRANVTLLVDGDATERNIRSALGTKLLNRTSPSSTVCIYYAGHGAPVVSLGAQRRSADNIDKYLVPYDAVFDDLRSSAISMDSIQQYFAWLEARQVIFFLDTCYSGAAGGRSFERDSFQVRALLTDDYLDSLAGEGRLVITACAPHEVSLESSGKGHGLFTYHLLEGLRGKADANSDGRVTADELYDYVSENVRRDARLMDGRMSPVRKGTVRGRVYLTESLAVNDQTVTANAFSDDSRPPEPVLPPRSRQRQRSSEAARQLVAVMRRLVAMATARLAIVTDWMATDDDRRKWLATAVVIVIAALIGVAAWPWAFSASPPGNGGSAARARGEVVFEWTGSTSVGWRIADANDETMGGGVAQPKRLSRASVPIGDFVVVVNGFPEVPRLPVNVIAGATSTVTPPIGRVEMTWSGANAVNVTVIDAQGNTVRPDWEIPANGARVLEIGAGSYSVVVPPDSRGETITVSAGRTSRLNLTARKADVIGPTPAPPGPSPAPAAGPATPYPRGPWMLPSGDLGFVEIPTGPFLMGSTRSRDKNALADEMDQHQVDVPAFFIGRYEVTVDQYRECVRDQGCVAGNPSVLQGPGFLPVRYVSWNDAMRYADWLDARLRSSTSTPAAVASALNGRRDGRQWKVRLPTEAEWEKAARGTDGRIYPWGDDVDASKANYGAGKEPTIVGKYRNGASYYRLFDMSGNVWEWTLSRRRSYPYRANDGREDTRRGNNDRVMRGGSFQTADVRAARRNWGREDERTDFTGFRLAIGPPR
jgi:formylglycine-generating enzyme required for sulfatase activity